MSPRSKIELDKIKSQKRLLILNSALEIFAENGYHASSIQMISKKAGISKGLMYSYFKNKEDLLRAIINKFIEEGWIFFDLNKDRVLSEDEFFFFIEKSIDSIRENSYAWKLYNALIFQPDVLNVVYSKIAPKQTDYVSILLSFFENIKCKNPQEELMFFSAILKGVTVMYIADTDNFPIEQYKNMIIKFYKEKFLNKEKK